jgi:hypothetical protein
MNDLIERGLLQKIKLLCLPSLGQVSPIKVLAATYSVVCHIYEHIGACLIN